MEIAGGGGMISECCYCCILPKGHDLPCIVPVKRLTFAPESEWRESALRRGTVVDSL